MTIPTWLAKRRRLFLIVGGSGLLIAGVVIGRFLRQKPIPPAIRDVREALALQTVLPAETAVRHRPHDPSARLELARVCLNTGDPAGAALALSPLIPGSSEAVTGQFVTACTAAGWQEEAEAALPGGPGSHSIRLGLASAWVARGESARGERLLAPLEREVLTPEENFTGARILLRARSYAAALRWAERGRDQALQDHDGLITAVRCYIAVGLPETARKLLADRASPALPGALPDDEETFWRGRAEVRCAQPDVRATGVRRLAEIALGASNPDGRRAIAAFEAGRSYLGSGRTNESIQLLAQAWKAGYQPDLCLEWLRKGYIAGGHSRDAAWCEGTICLTLHRWPEAVAAFRRRLDLDSSKPAAYLDLVHALTSEGRLPEALEVISRSRGVAPRDLDLTLLQAKVLGRLERVSEEAQVLSDAANWAGTRANEPLGNLGKMQYDSQQFDQAVSALERALAVDDGDAFSHLYLGLACSRRPEDPRQATLAVRHLLRAALIDPHYHYPWVNAGSVLLGMGDLPEAAACYRRALDGDSRWVGSYLALAQICQRQGLAAEQRFLLRLYGQARQVDTQRQEMEQRAKAPQATAADHFALGDRSLRDGRPKEALAELLIAVAQRPTWKQAQSRVADACALLDFDTMREEAERASHKN